MSASSGQEPASDSIFRLSNRKYLGCKKNLLDPILERMLAITGLPESFLDGFFGTGVVTAAIAARGVKRVISVDSLYFNSVILKAFFLPIDEGKRLKRLVDYLNDLQGEAGYITSNFAGLYFTEENCLRMDAVREEIENLRNTAGISGDEHLYLLAGFLLAADRVANTVGQYDAYLKHIGKDSILNGRHLVDNRVYSPFRLRMLETLGGIDGKVLTGDLLEIPLTFEVRVAYFDPPYNTRQYCDNYHLLENIARWEKPSLSGKTRKFPRDYLKSSFSRRSSVREAFTRLFERNLAPHVFLSYNSEGLLKKEELLDLLSSFGKTLCFELPYTVFGGGAGVSKKRAVTEYLFHLKRQA